MKVYVATGLERIHDQQRVATWLREAGHEITYDWGVHGPACGNGLDRIAEVAQNELQGVLSADIVLALLPGGRGTHLEIGIAVGAGVPVVLWREANAEGEFDDGLFEDDRRTCAFYHLHGFVYQVSAPLDSTFVVDVLMDVLATPAEIAQ